MSEPARRVGMSRAGLSKARSDQGNTWSTVPKVCRGPGLKLTFHAAHGHSARHRRRGPPRPFAPGMGHRSVGWAAGDEPAFWACPAEGRDIAVPPKVRR